MIRLRTVLAGIFIAALPYAALADASCGNSPAGFATWLHKTRQEAATRGFGKRALAALDQVFYAQSTINADRTQHSFKLDLEQFMRKRGASVIAARGKILKKQNAALFARIEKQYGVPPGPLLAIWGMETGFGHQMGKQHILSAAATLAYDCRRADFFTRQLYAALQLIDRGDFDPRAIGAMHGKIGQTQFLPLNIVQYGVDADSDGRIDMIASKEDALASTANFLRAHGWRAGVGYQPGEPNFAAIKGWNKATVYQQAIAIIARQIDGR